ncbi:MAG: 4-(cytidine 5'-diphospho)-2-C-methyl-D-erythritol kinase, partial [Bryobacteraceae bacterium]|nr:4-(cytidine 5'-diphospho)-2-C-methyl-D-erythritol kinase [Bryobacteraceae bacterium]
MTVSRKVKNVKVRVPAFAKINLALRVLYKRPDNFHELRTIFQTISVKDTLDIEWEKGGTGLEVASSIEIPGNIVVRAADALMAEMGVKARVRIFLNKAIPMGAGLGGGSTDAAAVLLALPALAGKHVPAARLAAIGAALGSDVPFFLLGGTALGIGRGEEVYPFPEARPAWGLLWTGGVPVSTAEAYRYLSGRLTVTQDSFNMNEFQSLSWRIRGELTDSTWSRFCHNDFEKVVFSQHPQLLQRKRKLQRAGAEPALMTGSGSAVFGFFKSLAEAEKARTKLNLPEVVLFRTMNRARYRAEWMR